MHVCSRSEALADYRRLSDLKAEEFPRGLNYLGLIVGVSGIATIYPAEVFSEIFGITQIIWFFWLGVFMLSHSNANRVAGGV